MIIRKHPTACFHNLHPLAGAVPRADPKIGTTDNPWIHGKFLCKGEGKWSRPGLRSYGAMGLKWWGSLTSKLDCTPTTSGPHLW